MRVIFLAAFAAVSGLAAGAAAQSPRDAGLRAFLSHALRGDHGPPAPVQGDEPGIRYRAAFADLNGDGRPEAIVYLLGADYCGTGGCTLTVLTPAGRSWRRVSDITIVNTPIRLLTTRHHGWLDLGVHVGGGGGRAFDARLSFNGRHYSENPSLAPSVRPGTAGRTLIADELHGDPLF